MNIKSLILALTLVVPTMTFGNDLRCNETGPDGEALYWPNQWTVGINTGSGPSQENLLKTRKLLKKGNLFKVTTIWEHTEDTALYLYANTEGHSPEEEVVLTRRRLATLEAIRRIPGNYVECSPIYRASPATGIHN